MLALALAPFAALQPQMPAPFDTLEGAYPYGEQLCLAITPDGTRTFSAIGAAIALLANVSETPSPCRFSFEGRRMPPVDQ